MCSYAVERRDRSGRFEYYCARFSRRMDVDTLEKCRTCREYVRLEG